MPGIADLIYSQTQTAGKPRTVTTEVKADEPLDLASLGLLLYFILSGQSKEKIGKTAIPGSRDMSGVQNRAPGSMPDEPYGISSVAGQNPIDLFKTLFSMFGG